MWVRREGPRGAALPAEQPDLPGLSPVSLQGPHHSPSPESLPRALPPPCRRLPLHMAGSGHGVSSPPAVRGSALTVAVAASGHTADRESRPGRVRQLQRLEVTHGDT